MPTITIGPGITLGVSGLTFSPPGSEVVTDPYFKYVTMLLHGDGTNGAQNNTFLDSSTNNFSITRNGNTTQGSFSPYGSNWSNYFGGVANNYLRIPSSQTPLNLSTGDFTVECWINLTSGGALNIAISAGGAWQLGYDGGGGRKTYVWNGSDVMTSTATASVNTWNHIAWTRSGSTMYLFLNGVQVATTTNSSSVDLNGSTISSYGADPASYPFYGYISNLRIVKGTAVYTSAFTPSTTPLTAISGTSLLTCQSNRFIDNSTNAFAITRNGTPSVQRWSPFSPSAAYSTSVIGGSGYFDGSGDYLTLATNSGATGPGTGNFTIEAWVYPTATSTVFDARPGGGNWSVNFYANGTLNLYYGSQTGYGVVPINQWSHIAITRSSGTVYYFINGALVGSTTNTTNLTGSSSCYIGRDTGSTYFTNAYMSDFRLVIGTAVYTSAFTPPTAPLTAITNTSLLTNFTNGGIWDNAMINDLETVGNAQISTSVKKYGSGSLAFDGSGDYLVEPTNVNFGYGTGDFTIEFWVYLNSTSTNITIVSNLSSASSTNPHIYFASAGSVIYYYTANADRLVSPAVSIATWYHVAVCRASGSTRMFINGVQAGSTYTDSNNYGTSAPLGIGTYWSAGSPVTSSTLNGYIDDLRITKGYARYTSNFTPPTAALPDQ